MKIIHIAIGERTNDADTERASLVTLFVTSVANNSLQTGKSGGCSFAACDHIERHCLGSVGVNIEHAGIILESAVGLIGTQTLCRIKRFIGFIHKGKARSVVSLDIELRCLTLIGSILGSISLNRHNLKLIGTSGQTECIGTTIGTIVANKFFIKLNIAAASRTAIDIIGLIVGQIVGPLNVGRF